MRREYCVLRELQPLQHAAAWLSLASIFTWREEPAGEVLPQPKDVLVTVGLERGGCFRSCQGPWEWQHAGEGLGNHARAGVCGEPGLSGPRVSWHQHFLVFLRAGFCSHREVGLTFFSILLSSSVTRLMTVQYCCVIYKSYWGQLGAGAGQINGGTRVGLQTACCAPRCVWPPRARGLGGRWAGKAPGPSCHRGSFVSAIGLASSGWLVSRSGFIWGHV